MAVGAAWQATRSRSTVYQTAVGQQQQIRLADGSTVDLAPDSRLEVGNGYGRTTRAVTLAGRGLFEVRHDAGRPFRVTAGGATIEDLGTAFEVAARGSAPVHVVVITGSVAVRSGGTVPAVTLQARDVATVRTNTPPVVSRAVSVEDLTSWRRGTLVFD
ncbi:MAG: FecR domain-containing protein, partial [Gemmatimonadota bacterium]